MINDNYLYFADDHDLTLYRIGKQHFDIIDNNKISINIDKNNTNSISMLNDYENSNENLNCGFHKINESTWNNFYNNILFNK